MVNKKKEQGLKDNWVRGSSRYLLKHSRPELSNCVREVSKAMKMAGEKHVKEVIRILTFILHNPNQALFVKPESTLKNPTIEEIKEFEWEIDGMSDSTWANKTEEGHSIAGWIIRIMGALAGWGCRQIKHITLSTAESEYAAALEMVKELQFVKKHDGLDGFEGKTSNENLFGQSSCDHDDKEQLHYSRQQALLFKSMVFERSLHEKNN